MPHTPSLTPISPWPWAERGGYQAEGLTLKEAALRLGYLSEEEFDRLADPSKMAHPEV